MIPFVNLKKEFDEINEEIRSAIENVLERQWFILGEELKSFETEFSEYVGAKYGIGVNSGSDALYLALKACEIGTGDEIITVANTFISTVDAIVRNGAEPVFIDINPNTFNIDLSKIEEKITNKTKAIIPVHLYGNPVEMTYILELAEKYNLKIIEDACQAHGAEYIGKKAGSIGDMGCFSFYPAKNLGAYGDAGMIITNNEEIAEKLKLFRNYGQKEKYYHYFVGISSRLDELQAAILRVKLKFLNEWNDKRREIAKLYNELLQGSNIIIPREGKFVKHVFHLYVIRSNIRDALKLYLNKNGIQTQIHYPIPIHHQQAYKKLKNIVNLPVTEKICKEILSLPMHPWLSEDDVIKITETIKKIN